MITLWFPTTLLSVLNFFNIYNKVQKYTTCLFMLMATEDNVINELSADSVGYSIESCRRRILTLQRSLQSQLDPEKQSELQMQLLRLNMVLEKQENAFNLIERPNARSPITTAIIVIFLIFVLVYFIVMLVMQALLPNDV